MSTLTVVEQILRETRTPMSVRQIVEHAGARLPTKSKTPDTVVARDLSMDIKRKGEDSIFIRTAPGRYTIREIHLQILASEQELAQQRDLAGQAQVAHEVEQVAPPGVVQMPPKKPEARPEARIDAREARIDAIDTGDARIAARPEATIAEPHATPILSSALREERAGTLPARAPAAAEDEQRTG